MVQVALLTRDLDFRTLFKAGIRGHHRFRRYGGLMAWKGYGVWSLVAQTLVYTTVSTGPDLDGLPLEARFAISHRVSALAFRLWLANVGVRAPQHILRPNSVGGDRQGFFRKRQLGFYTRAFSTQQFPVSLLSSVINRVTFPVFSQASHNRICSGEELGKHW